MPIEIIGYVPHTRKTETSGLWWSEDFDKDYIEECAIAHEEAGFDRVLVGQGSWGPDALVVASHVLAVTRTLKVFVAHRPGFIQPTVAARQLLTLDKLAGGGRVGFHIITGAPGGELHRDGDTLPDDERYARTGEYIDVLRKTWASDRPFDHDGKYYRIRQGFSSIPAGETPLISFGGSSAGALEVGPGRADYYMIFGEPLEQTQATLDELHRLGVERGLDPKVSVSLRAITAETEEAAWARAREIYAAAEAEIAASRPTDAAIVQAVARADSVGARKLDDIARSGDVHDERLWLGFTRLVGRGGSTATLVGTVDQVIGEYLKYRDAGAQAFYLRGFSIADDARAYGRDLIPRLRDAIADREARQASCARVS